ncbi:HD-like signal output (HDOD) domain, no enzymatic activity [Paucidesulfovibrio gracilis DSM 16080]|uniref:HD-like signal output (HDOD) domain, no enzymatic activity n=1 Tax=Paucidesulfovibrio gracilis DSM 16080 TaxID=1121449 RepID=A0A1T4W3P1_9BACT|nr:HDOD domain-containing protein [Paucidesulfovibrio gracilis]SKA71880.1 HD-like signal output (HDOD) domain, no enzymatic activity [Paucidesulfovibrio gracilis DSM 16080]
MQTINVDELAPDMILAKDIHGPDGRLLLAGNTILETHHLRVLRIWGITEAVILGNGTEPIRQEDDFPPEILHRAEQRVSVLFDACSEDHPATTELRRQCLLFRARALMENQEPHRVRHCPLVDPPKSSPPSLEEMLKQGDVFISFPETFFRILEVIDDPTSTARHLADVVGKDPGMTAKLLRLVNSPFYGFSRPVEQIERAVTLVGTRELSQLALGVTIIQSFSGISTPAPTTKAIWTHSLACGVFARVLASHLPEISGEALFVAGILHDTGRLVMLSRLPEIVAQAIIISHQECLPLYLAEQRLLGWDHTTLARELFQRWNLPPTLLETAAGHHAPTLCAEPRGASLLHMADMMTIALEYGFNGSALVPNPEPGAWECLDAPLSIIGPTIRTGARQLEDILTLFLS